MNPKIANQRRILQLNKRIQSCNECDLGGYTRERIGWQGGAYTRFALVWPLAPLRKERLRKALLNRELRTHRIKPSEVWITTPTNCYPYPTIVRDKSARTSCRWLFEDKLKLANHSIIVTTDIRFIDEGLKEARKPQWQYTESLGWVLIYKASMDKQKFKLPNQFVHDLEKQAWPEIPWKLDSLQGYDIQERRLMDDRKLVRAMNRHGWMMVTVNGLKVIVAKEGMSYVPGYNVAPITLKELALLRTRPNIEAFMNLRQGFSDIKVAI